MCWSEILEIPTIAGENSRVFWLAGSFKPDREAISVQRPTPFVESVFFVVGFCGDSCLAREQSFLQPVFHCPQKTSKNNILI